ncbi:MAG: DUF1732 domain-containing protein [Bacteroidota bacterium]
MQSMTGYGDSSFKLLGIHIFIQLVSLNSRTFDLQLDIPIELQGYAMKWRELLANHLQRGRVQLAIKLTHEISFPLTEEKEMIAAYFKSLAKIAQELNTKTDLLGKAVDIALSRKWENKLNLDTQVINAIQLHVDKVLQTCLASRAAEGKRLGLHLQSYIVKIKEYLLKVSKHLSKRKKSIRERFLEQKKLLDITPTPNCTTCWDKEVNQYWDKMDVEEEVVRLKSHLSYFESTIIQNRPIGKQLGFIIQEIARELNTIGAKAQDTTLQHFVVELKDSLEQVKEQIQNIL